MHRIGGLEKQDVTGNVNYEPANHEHMVDIAGQEGRRHRRRHSAASGRRPGARRPAGAELGRHVRRVRHGRRTKCASQAASVAHAHLRYLNPLPANLGEILQRYEQVLIPELNLGQLRLLIRGQVPGRCHRPEQGARPAVHASAKSWTRFEHLLS